MKFINIIILAFASLATAAITFCRDNSTDHCLALIVNSSGCYDLVDWDGFVGTTHYISTTDNMRCNVYNEAKCKGTYLGQVTAAGKHFDSTASSAQCVGQGP